MLSFKGYTIFCAFAVLTLTLRSFFVVADAQSAKIGLLPVRSGVFAVHLETQERAYRVNQPVLIKMELVNKSDDLLAVVPEAPWYITDLVVHDRRGSVVQPTTKKFPARGSPGSFLMQPHSTQLLRWGNLNNEPEEWVDLGKWGYAPLPPGEYTITAIPTPDAAVNPTPNADAEHIAPRITAPYSVQSNELHITVVP